MGLSFFKKHIPFENLKMLGQINGSVKYYIRMGAMIVEMYWLLLEKT